MISIFACGLRLHRKTYPPSPPHFSSLVSVSLFRNNVCKTHFFSWRRFFQTKLLLFQTIESAKSAFAARAGSGKPALLHAFDFSKTNNKTAEQITGQSFRVKSNVTSKDSTHFEPPPPPPKKKRSKKSLTMLMHVDLHLKKDLFSPVHTIVDV